MLKASYTYYILDFRFQAKTSREVMSRKATYFIKVFDDSSPERYGIGECALFRGLSCDDRPDYEAVLAETCKSINNLDIDRLRDYPSILFGVETALLDLKNGGEHKPFPSAWSQGETEIPINGLVWMGSIDEMQRRIEEKLSSGFRCLKFKIGGADFNRELELLKNVRSRYSADKLEIRLDANGAFSPDNALSRLDHLSKLQIHSLEQPIKAGMISNMERICKESPIPIALDEELIGHNFPEDKYELLSRIKPAYIILKPALCGGFSGAMEWISIAKLLSIGWWATSALESNIGLNAIAQWVSTLNTSMPQGLGTGALYYNNIASPLEQIRDVLIYKPSSHWKIPDLQWR